MTVDLSGLERMASRLGLGELRARLVPPERRAETWFRWDEGELQVSERVVERLRPDEGAILLAHMVIERRHRRRARVTALILTASLVLLAVALASRWPGSLVQLVVGALVLAGLCAVGLRGRASVAADDAAVEFLGDPDQLVRTLNVMHQDEIHVGGLKTRARPDIHSRAERLVRRHQLRLPPELRQGGCDGGRA